MSTNRPACADRPTNAAAAPAPIPLARETDYYGPTIRAAHIAGWIVAHFRPGLTKGGQYRTPVQGDGKGFPDFVLVHGGAGRVWFVEFKLDGAKLTREQRVWGETLIAAGAVYRTVYCPSQIAQFRQDLVDAVRPM